MEYVKLGEVATIVNGYAFSRSKYENEGIPIVRISDIDEEINLENCIHYPEDSLEKFEDYTIKKGSLLIALSGATTGKMGVFVSDKVAYLNQRICSIFSNNKNLLQEYLILYLKNLKKLILKNSYGGAQPNISSKWLEKIDIKIPSLKKQEQIIKHLKSVKKIIELKKIQLLEIENLKKSQFFEMFGNPIKNEKGWEKVSMDEISRLIIRGKTPKYVMDSKIGIINQACIYWEKIKFENIKYHENNEKVLNLENQDVLINSTGTGTLGRVNIFTKDKENDKVYTIDTHVTLVRLKKEKVNSIYLKNFFRVPIVQEYLMSRCVNGSTNQIELSKEKFKKFRVLLPPLELQNKFATRIEAIQKLKFEIEKSLKETENLYNSLMQKFFSNK